MRFQPYAPRALLLGLTTTMALLLSAIPAWSAWPGRNGRLVAQTQFGGGGLFTVSPDGTGRSPLTDPKNDSQPQWDPTGRRIVFTRGSNQNGGFSGDAQIFVINGDGSGLTNVSNSATNDFSPGWSPDGSKIAFARGQHFGGSSIWVMNADGTNQHQLFAPPTGKGDAHPRYSPDGTKILFDRTEPPSSNHDIYVVNADGSGTPQDVTNTAADDEIRGEWTTDSRRIVFTRRPGTPSQADPSGIWIMNADGSDAHVLVPATASAEQIFADAVSPDDTQIVYARSPDNFQTSQLFVANIDGSNPHAITAPGSRDAAPDWQPLANVTSSAQVPPCTGNVAVTVGDASGFLSPPAGVHYSIDGGDEQTGPTLGSVATITLPEGQHSLTFWGQNQAGDQEADHHTVTVVVDRTAPAVRIVRNQKRFTFRRGQFASVTITASDGGGLAVNPSRKRRRLSTSRLGIHTIRATAVDRCGNRRTASLRYRVVRAKAARRPARRVVPRFTG